MRLSQASRSTIVILICANINRFNISKRQIAQMSSKNIIMMTVNSVKLQQHLLMMVQDLGPGPINFVMRNAYLLQSTFSQYYLQQRSSRNHDGKSKCLHPGKEKALVAKIKLYIL